MKNGQPLSAPEGIQREHLVGKRMAVITASYNSEITSKLKEGALGTLKEYGLSEDQILVVDVPGAYELPLAAALCMNAGFDAVIALGCVIRGETTHYDYVCQAAERGLSSLQLEYLRPVVFGVLTTENLAQAQARAGGDYGNKGEEAAWSALRMLTLNEEIKPLDTQ